MTKAELPFTDMEVGQSFIVLPIHGYSWLELKDIIKTYKVETALRFTLRDIGEGLEVRRLRDATFDESKKVFVIDRLVFEVKAASTEMIPLINKKALNAENPLPPRKMRIPLNTLPVGMSIWINMDETALTDWQACRMSVTRYNRMYGEIFHCIKHRGDQRVATFKYLEIGRIK